MTMYQQHAPPSLYKSSYASPEELRVLALEPNATKGLFVGDLSSFCTEKDLYAMYSPFGTILAIEIKRGRHGDSLLHGFVEYDSIVASFRAMEAFHGQKIMGRRMRCVPSLSLCLPPSVSPFSCVYSVNWTNVKVPPKPVETWTMVQVHFLSKNVSPAPPPRRARLPVADPPLRWLLLLVV